MEGTGGKELIRKIIGLEFESILAAIAREGKVPVSLLSKKFLVSSVTLLLLSVSKYGGFESHLDKKYVDLGAPFFFHS